MSSICYPLRGTAVDDIDVEEGLPAAKAMQQIAVSGRIRGGGKRRQKTP